MNLWQRLKLATKFVRTGAQLSLQQKSLPFSLPVFGVNNPVYPLVDLKSYFVEGYQQNSVVYSCIRKIATTAPAAKLSVVSRDSVGGLDYQIEHPLLRLFQQPNPYITGFEFQELFHTFLNIAGEVYLLPVGVDRDGLPKEIYFVRPDRIHPVPGQRKLLGYVYDNFAGNPTPFLPEEVIHVKLPNPYDMWEGLGRGLSPLSAGARAGDVDNQGAIYLDQFFKNGAVPFGLLTSKSVLDQPRIDLIRQRLKDQHAGSSKWHEAMIIDAEVTYQQLGVSIDKIAMPNINDWSETRICAVFDVPPLLIGLSAGLKNEGGLTSALRDARRFFWEDKLIPDNVRMEEVFTRFFAKHLKPGEKISHDYRGIEVLEESRTQKFTRANQAWLGGWRTLDETRAEVGDSPLADGTGNRFYEKPKKEKADVKTN